MERLYWYSLELLAIFVFLFFVPKDYFLPLIIVTVKTVYNHRALECVFIF
jgi:hypothetical protein